MKRRTKPSGTKWGPEIARVVSVDTAVAEAVIEALEALSTWAAKRKLELDAERRTFDTQYEADISRGQWLAWDELLNKYLRPNLDKARRAAK